MKRRGFTITELSVTIAVSTVLLLAIVALIVSSQSYSQFRTVDALLDDEMKAIESGVNSFINEIDTLGGFGAPVISGGGDVNAEITLEKKVEIAKEIGDVLWFCAALANDIGFDLETIGQMNYDKLYSRKKRGMLHGSGDNR